MKRSGFRKQPPEEIRAKQAVKREKLLTATKLRKTSKNGTVALRRRSTKASKLRRKRGEWATSTADNYFSKWVRERDGKCLRCGRLDQLTCSHYHKRAISITRYAPENCIALCGECHALWEGPKEGYTDLMIKMMGTEAFLELQRKAGRFMKRSDAVAEWKAFYQTVDN